MHYYVPLQAPVQLRDRLTGKPLLQNPDTATQAVLSSLVGSKRRSDAVKEQAQKLLADLGEMVPDEVEPMSHHRWYLTHVEDDPRLNGKRKAQRANARIERLLAKGCAEQLARGSEIPIFLVVDEEDLKTVQPVLDEPPPAREVVCQRCGSLGRDKPQTIFDSPGHVSLQFAGFSEALLIDGDARKDRPKEGIFVYDDHVEAPPPKETAPPATGSLELTPAASAA